MMRSSRTRFRFSGQSPPVTSAKPGCRPGFGVEVRQAVSVRANRVTPSPKEPIDSPERDFCNAQSHAGIGLIHLIGRVDKGDERAYCPDLRQ